MDDAKKELGCDSMENCSAFCSQPQNRQKCAELVQKQTAEANSQSAPQNTKPCTSDEECKIYCQNHPNECPGFPTSSTTKKSTVQNSSGDFIGPAGCKTQGECQAYCQKHPKECPNFPTSTSTQDISETKNPSQTGSPPQTNGDQKPQFTPPPFKDSGLSSEKNKFK